MAHLRIGHSQLGHLDSWAVYSTASLTHLLGALVLGGTQFHIPFSPSVIRLALQLNHGNNNNNNKTQLSSLSTFLSAFPWLTPEMNVHKFSLEEVVVPLQV